MNRNLLPGEGEVSFVKRTRVRHACINCSEPAEYRNTYLLPNARRNPRSKAYGQDDVSYCSDYEQFLCSDCYDDNYKDDVGDNLEWCATFNSETSPRFFLYWLEEPVVDQREDVI